MISQICYRFKEKALAKRSGNMDRSPLYKEVAEIKTCLLFCVAGEEPQIAIEMLQQRMPGVKFKKLYFIPKGAAYVDQSDVVAFRQEELGFGGRIKNEPLADLLSQEFDLLIDLTTVVNVLTLYVLKMTRARCIVGRRRDESIADIMIDGTDDFQDFAVKLMDLLVEINEYEYDEI